MPTKKTVVTRADFGIWPSERLTDNDDGGGLPTGERLKGEANELFKPISSIMRTNGGFSAALAYAGIQRTDDAPLIGSFAAITKPPKDPAVSYLLFPATKHGELREEILKRIEAYSVGTIESRMTLLSTQSQNSKIIQAYQRPGEPLPIVGDVYCLRQDKPGYPQHEQYVQVTRVESEDRTFTSRADKEFIRTVVKLEISSKLETDFIGAEYPSEGYIDVPCKVRETHVADAAQYYGIKPISEPIEKDKMQIKIPSLMEKLVPTNQIDIALLDLTAAGQRQTLFDGSRAGDDGVMSLTVNKYHNAGSISTISLGNAAMPGSINIATSAGVLTDKGGLLIFNDVPLGTANYASGELVINDRAWAGQINTVKFRAASAEMRVADTARIPVDINSRRSNYNMTINPPPAPGSLMVSYRAQGRWYDLVDDGTGSLRGLSAAHGTGTISFKTGTVNIDTGELPDVGSSVLLAWSTRARYLNRAGGAATAQMLLNLSKDAVPSTLSIKWNDGAAKTAVSDASGNITGDWTGKYDPKSRQIRIDTGANFKHPNGLLDITVQYSTGEGVTSNIVLSALDSAGKVSFTAPGFLPNTLQLRYTIRVPDSYEAVNQDINISIRDDGLGNLLNEQNVVVGSIDYSTGKGKFNPKVSLRLAKRVFDQLPATMPSDNHSTGGSGSGGGNVVRQMLSHYEYETVELTLSKDSTTSAVIDRFASSSESTAIEHLTSGDIEIDLLPIYAETVAPASVNVTWAGHAYFDKLGGIYTDLDPKTGAATAVGTINYQTAKITLKSWHWTNGAAPIINSLVTSIGVNPVDAVTFRVPTAPIRPGSLRLRATTTTGEQISATASNSGELKATSITGFVDAEYGVGDVRFGNWVTAVGNEAEDWYDPSAIVNGKIWRPVHVIAESITYSTSAYSYLPIDSKVVKIDTVRLPQDGRIPIFRRGDNILITNSQTDDIGSAHTGGQTVQLSRGDVDRICVSDADGKPVNAELWDYDLEAGTITWKTPLDLSTYKMPLSVMHAQEERNRIRLADIDGTLSLIFPTKRAYPIDSTYVSSILIGGDLEVRVSIPFTQRNWDMTWRDEPQGGQLLNKLNIKDYPMILTDKGAIKERWLIKFISGSQFELYGETLGYVGKFDTLSDLKPMNPAAGAPYFVLPKESFGAEAPWAPQDVVRFDTWGTLLAVWVLRAVQPTPDAPEGDDGFTMCLFGDTTEIIN